MVALPRFSQGVPEHPEAMAFDYYSGRRRQQDQTPDKDMVILGPQHQTPEALWKEFAEKARARYMYVCPLDGIRRIFR